MPTNNTPDVTERDRARRALELRTQGKPWGEIADELGYSDESGARKAATRLLDRVEAEDVIEYRHLELARLDEVHRAFWDSALDGDAKSAEIVLKTSDRRVKLLGLAVPERFVMSANTVSTDEELTETIAGLLRDLAAPEPEPEVVDDWIN